MQNCTARMGPIDSPSTQPCQPSSPRETLLPSGNNQPDRVLTRHLEATVTALVLGLGEGTIATTMAIMPAAPVQLTGPPAVVVICTLPRGDRGSKEQHPRAAGAAAAEKRWATNPADGNLDRSAERNHSQRTVGFLTQRFPGKPNPWSFS